MPKEASNIQLVHIRMPKAFHRRLMRDADRNGQTLNAEILKRLEESYQTASQTQEVSDKLDKVRTEISVSTAFLKKWITEHYAKAVAEAYERAVDAQQKEIGKPSGTKPEQRPKT